MPSASAPRNDFQKKFLTLLGTDCPHNKTQARREGGGGRDEGGRRWGGVNPLRTDSNQDEMIYKSI